MKIKKLLIANRGEIAIRIIRTCKEMGIKTIALCPAPGEEKNFLETKLADEYYFLEKEGSSGYLDKQKIIEIAKRAEADAIHPGYGFLAENWKFALLCAKNKIKFIGPHYNILRRFEDKVEAKKIAKKLGVPTLPASDRPIRTTKDLFATAQRIKPPFIFKAQRGGGGMGIRVIDHDLSGTDFLNITSSIQKQMAAGFSDLDFFLEKYLPNSRHIEFQVLGDGRKAVHLGERDCTIQRRFQKLIEESPSSFLSEKQREEMGFWSKKICEDMKYQGAATVEFLMDQEGNYYFMEVNPRIQVEHPVTEATTGIDIVEQQIRIARGEQIPFSQKDIHFSGWAIEARINAEDPQKNFLPTPGIIKKYVSAGGQGIFVHSFLQQGQEISPCFDSLIAKVIAHGKTRNEAIGKLKRALDEIIIEGVATTIPFFKILLRHQDFLKGEYDSNFIEKTGILKEIMYDPETQKQLEANLVKDISEPELAEAIFQVYSNLKNNDCSKKNYPDSWKLNNRFKMMR